MKIITMRNLKGGVGKTNLAISIAAHLNLEGFKVALIDTEEFGTVGQIVKSKERKNYLIQLKNELIEKIEGCALNYKHLDSYVQKLNYVEKALNFEVINNCMENIEVFVKEEVKKGGVEKKKTSQDYKNLEDKIYKLYDSNYDYVIIDTPGREINDFDQIAGMSSLILIPQKDTILDFNGVVKSLVGIKDLNKCRRVIWDDRSSCFEGESLSEEAKLVDSDVVALSSKVLNSKGFNRALSKGLSVCEMNRICSGKESISTNKSSKMIAELVNEIKQIGE